MRDNVIELVELDRDPKWSLLRHYYKAAVSFYSPQDEVVSEEEIRQHIDKFKEKPLPRRRKEIKLRDWKFQFDKDNEGVRKGYFSKSFDERGWKEVTAPHSFRHVPENPVKFGVTCDPVFLSPDGVEMPIWRGDYTTWYKKRVNSGIVDNDSVAYINFESVNLVASVWINEMPVMFDHYGLYPMEMEVTNELNCAGDGISTIAVKVDNIASNIPVMFSNGLQTAYCNSSYVSEKRNWFMHDDVFSGIAGEATLTVRNKNHIDSAFFFTKSIFEKEAFLGCRIRLRNTSWHKFAGSVRVELSKWSPAETGILQSKVMDVSSLPMNESTQDVELRVRDADLWDTDNPNLYLAHIVLLDAEGREIDDIFETFGIRTIRVMGTSIYLNGRRIVPRGTHNHTHYHGDSMICPSDRIIVKDILMHKKLGATASRWPSDSKVHYKKIADYCDQMGYMISWAGYYEMWQIHPESEMHATRDVKAMVRSLRNCPSIVFWEMGDEPYMLMHQFKKPRWYELMYRLVSEEDTTRPIIPTGHWCQDLVDRITERIDAASAESAKRIPGSRARDDGLVDTIRAQVLEEFPVYNDMELAVWDYHYCPHVSLNPKPNYYYVDLIKRNLGGKRFTVFTEFGIDGLPAPEKLKKISDVFMWTSSPYWPINKHNSDMGYYGRDITQNDWKETQACQAIVLSNVVSYLREDPDYFGAFYFICMFDWSTFYWGIADGAGNCKLAYFAVQDCYRPVFVSCLHGNTVVGRDELLQVVASNLGEEARDLKLRIVMKDSSFKEIMVKNVAIESINGTMAVTKIAELDLGAVQGIGAAKGAAGLESRLFTIESYVYDKNQALVAKNLEVFYIGDKKSFASEVQK